MRIMKIEVSEVDVNDADTDEAVKMTEAVNEASEAENVADNATDEEKADKFLNDLDGFIDGLSEGSRKYYDQVYAAATDVIKTYPKWMVFKTSVTEAGIPVDMVESVENSMAKFLAVTVIAEKKKTDEKITEIIESIVSASIEEFFKMAPVEYGIKTIISTLSMLQELEDKKKKKDAEAEAESENK